MEHLWEKHCLPSTALSQSGLVPLVRNSSLSISIRPPRFMKNPDLNCWIARSSSSHKTSQWLPLSSLGRPGPFPAPHVAPSLAPASSGPPQTSRPPSADTQHPQSRRAMYRNHGGHTLHLAQRRLSVCDTIPRERRSRSMRTRNVSTSSTSGC